MHELLLLVLKHPQIMREMFFTKNGINLIIVKKCTNKNDYSIILDVLNKFCIWGKINLHYQFIISYNFSIPSGKYVILKHTSN